MLFQRNSNQKVFLPDILVFSNDANVFTEYQ